MLDENGILRAEIEFPDTGVNTVTITHTFVDETLKGRGIAQRLTETVVMQAEKKRKKDSSRMLVRRSLVRPSSRI